MLFTLFYFLSLLPSYIILILVYLFLHSFPRFAYFHLHSYSSLHFTLLLLLLTSTTPSLLFTFFGPIDQLSHQALRYSTFSRTLFSPLTHPSPSLPFSLLQVGEDRLIRFSGCKSGSACTIILRGASSHLLDEAERSLHDALCVLTETVKETRSVCVYLEELFVIVFLLFVSLHALSLPPLSSVTTHSHFSYPLTFLPLNNSSPSPSISPSPLRLHLLIFPYLILLPSFSYPPPLVLSIL